MWLWTETYANFGKTIAAAAAAMVFGLVPFTTLRKLLEAQSSLPNWVLALLLLVTLATLLFIARLAVDRWQSRRFSLLIIDQKLELLWRIHRPVEQWVNINLKNASEATIDSVIDGPYDSANKCYAPLTVGCQELATICPSCGRQLAIASVIPCREYNLLNRFPSTEQASFPLKLMKKCMLIALQQRYIRGGRIKNGLKIVDAPYSSVFQ